MINLDASWRHSVFFTYPQSNLARTWNAPVEWTDGLLLYVPDLSEKSIVDAICYLYRGSAWEQTFEDYSPPSGELPSNEVLPNVYPLNATQLDKFKDPTEQSILQKLTQIIMQIKLLGNASTSAEIKTELNRYADQVFKRLNEGSATTKEEDKQPGKSRSDGSQHPPKS